MRPIKFRSWDKEKKVIIYDNSQETGEIYNLLIGADINNTVRKIGHYYKTLMQFTGLLDKNGKEIYEGDILRTDFDFVAEVVFGQGFFYIETKEDVECVALCEWCDHMSEVIGNIHESPELLG